MERIDGSRCVGTGGLHADRLLKRSAHQVSMLFACVKVQLEGMLELLVALRESAIQLCLLEFVLPTLLLAAKRGNIDGGCSS